MTQNFKIGDTVRSVRDIGYDSNGFYDGRNSWTIEKINSEFETVDDPHGNPHYFTNLKLVDGETPLEAALKLVEANGYTVEKIAPVVDTVYALKSNLDREIIYRSIAEYNDMPGFYDKNYTILKTIEVEL